MALKKVATWKLTNLFSLPDFHVGVVTMFIGFVFLFIEIPILADMHLELAGKLQQQEEENGTHQGSNLIADTYICFVCKE